MNKWAIGTKDIIPVLKSQPCFHGVGIAGEKNFCYYKIAKLFNNDINSWYLNLVKKIFNFDIIEDQETHFLIRLKLNSCYFSNLAKLTLLRYIDKNELDNANIKDIPKKAFELKDQMPDLHALMIAHYINKSGGDGHYICKTLGSLWYNPKVLGNLISITQVKKNLTVKANPRSVHQIFIGDKTVRPINPNESPEDYYKEIVKVA